MVTPLAAKILVDDRRRQLLDAAERRRIVPRPIRRSRARVRAGRMLIAVGLRLAGPTAAGPTAAGPTAAVSNLAVNASFG